MSKIPLDSASKMVKIGIYCTREASELLEVSVFLIRGRLAGRKQSPNKTIDFGPFFSNYILTVLSVKIARSFRFFGNNLQFLGNSFNHPHSFNFIR